MRKGRRGEIKIEWEQDKFAVAVVLASEGYGEREDVPVNRPITGLNSLDEDVRIFHGATKLGEEGRLVTAGGRVLTLVATGANLEEARVKVYANVERVEFHGRQYRTDIGLI